MVGTFASTVMKGLMVLCSLSRTAKAQSGVMIENIIYKKAPLMGAFCFFMIQEAIIEFGIVEKSKHKENNLLALKSFIANLEVLDFGINEAIVYSKLRVDLEKRKQLIGAMDMLIASVAIANSLTLITNNTKEFERILDLNIENWA